MGGWKFNNTLGSDFVMAADRNPGNLQPMTNGNTAQTAVNTVQYNSGSKAMAQGNSNNHGNEGQEVLYCDGHVEFQNTPFCGPQAEGVPYRDNIYTMAGLTFSSTGTGTETNQNSSLNTLYDAFLLPAGGSAQGY